VARANQQDRMNVFRGLAVGTVVGIVASILVLKLIFYTHFGLGWLYTGVGYAIGYSIWKFTGRGGPGLAAAAVGIMIVSLVIAHLVYAADVLNLVRDAGKADPGATLFDALPFAMSTFRFWHWICIAIGIGACWRGVEQQEG
jgi:hypothetical protein